MKRGDRILSGRWADRKFFLYLILLSLASCRNAPKSSDRLAEANRAALEQTVDLESRTVESDDVLRFEREVVELGEIPLGESRVRKLEAVNGSDKPLVLLDVRTSCQCTRVTWDRKPVPPGGRTAFEIRFAADQPGTFFKKIAVRHSGSAKPVSFAIEGVVTDGKAAKK